MKKLSLITAIVLAATSTAAFAASELVTSGGKPVGTANNGAVATAAHVVAPQAAVAPAKAAKPVKKTAKKAKAKAAPAAAAPAAK